MTFVRAAASAAIITLLSTVGATAKPVATTAETNLRKSPGTNSEVVTLIPKGTTVEVGKCTNGWCEASVDGKDGFVIGRNVGMGRAADPRWSRKKRSSKARSMPGRRAITGPIRITGITATTGPGVMAGDGAGNGTTG
jgi:uncharacterized protein YraI